MPKYLNKVNVSQKVEEVVVEVPKLGLGPAFFWQWFAYTDFQVMSSIIMEVIDMYVSIAIKLSKYLTELSMHSVSTFNKANVNSFMCDALFS